MPPSKNKQRKPTLRKMTSSSLSEGDIGSAARVMTERTDSMGLRAKERAPLTADEMQGMYIPASASHLELELLCREFGFVLFPLILIISHTLTLII